MASDAKEQIRQRLDIAEIVGDVVALKPAGRGQLKGLCPFHSEKTPSFHVHRDRGFYYCFGCQAKGDVFDFVMKTRGLSFAEVLQTMGQRVGVEVTPPTARDRKRNDLYDVNDLALGYFCEMLASDAGAAAREYFAGRGLSDDTVERFSLGFAPDGWDGLLRYALGKGLRDDDLLSAGLLAENENGRRYDRFRNRVIFPIRDPLGRVVGFAGRVLDDSLPKYLNTPETDIFHKGELLYGLDLARNEIRQRNECIVVEGYMDVIALHQAGVGHVVAALGATLTGEQADQLSRLDVQRLYLAFDADSAGQRAVLSGLEQAVGRQFLVRAVQVPFGKDPADAVMSGHLPEFMAALEEGLSEVEFRFGSVLEKYDASTVQGQKAILNELRPALKPRSVFDPVASEVRRLVIDRLGIDDRALDSWLGSSRGAERLDDTQVRGMKRRGGSASQTAIIELEIIALLLLEPGHLEQRLEQVEMALPPVPDSLLREFAHLCREKDFDDREVLLHYRERDEGGVVWSRLFGDGGGDESIDVDGNIEQALSRLRELHLDGEKSSQQSRLLERKEEIQALLADASLPAERLERLYSELKEIYTKQVAREAERRLRVPAGYMRRKRG